MSALGVKRKSPTNESRSTRSKMTHNRHPPLWIVAAQNGARPLFRCGQFPALIDAIPRLKRYRHAALVLKVHLARFCLGAGDQGRGEGCRTAPAVAQTESDYRSKHFICRLPIVTGGNCRWRTSPASAPLRL